MIRLLVIDDEVAIRRLLKASLDPKQFEVIEAADGEEGIRKAAREKPDVILLDLGLPDMDGTRVAAEIRGWSETPIIVLSVRETEQEKVKALDAGADDYVTKPFGINELMARIRVAMRHTERVSGAEGEPTFELGGLKVDLAKRLVYRDGEQIHLTPIEYRLLALLVRHSGKVLTHRQMLTEVWGPAYAEENHYLRVYMGQLRHKLEADPARPALLINEPGVGYRLREP